jgi:hypothetical protein
MYANRIPPASPPCDTCRVILLEENEEDAEVFMLIRGQIITAGQDNRPVDINLLSVKAIIDMERHQRQQLLRIQNIWHHFNKQGD